MQYSKARSITGIFLVALSCAPAVAQRGGGAPPPPMVEPWVTVRSMADALGHIRQVARSDRAVGAILFVGKGTLSEPRRSGTWPQYKISKVVGEAAYFTRDQPNSSAKAPGARWDIEYTGADGKAQRMVHVVAGKQAWNETKPGVGPTAAQKEFAYRQMQLWLQPHALALAAMKPEPAAGAADGVKLQAGAAQPTLIIPVNGTPVTVTLDANKRPARVEADVEHPVLGKVKLENLYSDYRNFEVAYLVYFPARIVQKINGRTTLDLTVDEFHTNPYVVFPVPREVSAAARSN